MIMTTHIVLLIVQAIALATQFYFARKHIRLENDGYQFTKKENRNFMWTQILAFVFNIGCLITILTL